VSPRKSSTSSGRAKPRPRYLGLEAAGEPVPRLPPRGWETALRSAWARTRADPPPLRFRIVRSDGRRAIVEVEHAVLPAARAAWNGAAPDLPGLTLRTKRTWGTLVGAKRWWRAGE
jgi:hypothetical protein